MTAPHPDDAALFFHSALGECLDLFGDILRLQVGVSEEHSGVLVTRNQADLWN